MPEGNYIVNGYVQVRNTGLGTATGTCHMRGDANHRIGVNYSIPEGGPVQHLTLSAASTSPAAADVGVWCRNAAGDASVVVAIAQATQVETLHHH